MGWMSHTPSINRIKELREAIARLKEQKTTLANEAAIAKWEAEIEDIKSIGR